MAESQTFCFIAQEFSALAEFQGAVQELKLGTQRPFAQKGNTLDFVRNPIYYLLFII